MLRQIEMFRAGGGRWMANVHDQKEERRRGGMEEEGTSWTGEEDGYGENGVRTRGV